MQRVQLQRDWVLAGEGLLNGCNQAKQALRIDRWRAASNVERIDPATFQRLDVPLNFAINRALKDGIQIGVELDPVVRTERT